MTLTTRQYIGRIPLSNGRTGGWQVRGSAFAGSKYFAASKHGGIMRALAAAQKWRDRHVKRKKRR